MKLNILGVAVSDQLTGAVAASVWQGIRGWEKSKILLIECSISDPELLPGWLDLDILALKRQAGQRIIQLLLDQSKFTLESAPILSTYFTFSHPSLGGFAVSILFIVY